MEITSEHRKASNYPEPLIISPIREHRHTLILLHGRGSNASSFAPALLAMEIPTVGNLVEAFPHARFVFPTASKRRVAASYDRVLFSQWFDCWSLVDPSKREELQIEGLRETTIYLHELLKEEIALVGAKNVVLWGLSQGCAALLISLLTWPGEPLAAAVGMCGWLPFRDHLEEIVRDRDITTHIPDNQTPILHSHDEQSKPRTENSFSPIQPTPQNPPKSPPSPVIQALTHLSEELLQIPTPQLMAFKRTPLFLGHGMEDEKIPIVLGKDAARCLGEAMAMEVVRWREYEGLGHWYSKEMLSDIAGFVREGLEWMGERAG